MAKHVAARPETEVLPGSGQPGYWLALRPIGTVIPHGRWERIQVGGVGWEAVTTYRVEGMNYATPRCQSALKSGAQCSSAATTFDPDVEFNPNVDSAQQLWRCGRHAMQGR